MALSIPICQNLVLVILFIMNNHRPSVLLIYTGGTIGMIENPETGALENFDFDHLKNFVPELKRFNMNIDSFQFNPPIDSSDMDPSYWVDMAKIVERNHKKYDGFVILHGTDTMSYTASALSFMLENVNKPVILTGSQLPIGKLRTDGKENLLTAIEIAAALDKEGNPMVPEVCVFFENHLMRGNRTVKHNAENFNAFSSFNYPPLATVGIHIRYEHSYINKVNVNKPFKTHYLFDPNVAVITLFPGIQESIVRPLFENKDVKAIVLRTYGSGNAPQKPWLIELIKKVTQRKVLVVNITQCDTGSVEMQRYETGLHLLEAGVVSGYDSTTESAITKLMFLLGKGCDYDEIRKLMDSNLAGEITQ